MPVPQPTVASEKFTSHVLAVFFCLVEQVPHPLSSAYTYPKYKIGLFLTYYIANWWSDHVMCIIVMFIFRRCILGEFDIFVLKLGC